MNDYDRILLSTRWSELKILAQRQQEWAEARRALAEAYGPSSTMRHVASLRGRLRRSLKRRRNVA